MPLVPFLVLACALILASSVGGIQTGPLPEGVRVTEPMRR